MEGVREGRHLAAIMFVDMVGYSARMQENEARAIETVRELWGTFRPMLAAHGGREIDLAGDGMLTEFSGALAAVRCAMELQDALRARNQQRRGDEQVRVRAGLHLGDIEHRDGRIYGDGVNIAARVIALAPPAAIAMTPHVRDQLLNVLERAPHSLGEKLLKGIRHPMELWCLPGPDCTAAELAAAKAAARPAPQDHVWRFGRCSFDSRTLELTVGDSAVELEKKVLDVLLFLLRHAGEVVTKEELLEGAWPGRIISDSALTTCIAKLRDALGDEDQEMLKTVHGFGYRFAANVSVEALAEAAAPSLDFKEGDRLPQRPLWTLVRHLGGGGHGEAWLARHDKTHEERVYKFALAPEHLASLKREITLSRLLGDVPGGKERFVRVLDWDLEQTPYFIECEFASGGSLVDWAAAQGGLAAVPLATRREIAAQAAEALAMAHSVGVLHKDLKPANLLIEPSPLRVRLADFGSGGVLDPARLAELGITRMGFTRTVMDTGSDSSTASYLAPEVLSGQPWTSQADIYALGVVLFQLVVGDFRRVLAPGWERDISDEFLREDIARTAAGAPKQRFTDAAALAQNLRTLDVRRAQRAQELKVQAKAQKQQQVYQRYRVRRWWTAGITAVLMLALIGGWFVWFDTWIAYGGGLGALGLVDDLVVEAEKRGDYKMAESILRRSLVVQARRQYRDPFGEEDWKEIIDHVDLARVLTLQSRYLEAKAILQTAMSLAASSFGKDDYEYWIVAARHGELLVAAGESTEAHRVLTEARDGITRALPDLDQYDRPFAEKRVARITSLIENLNKNK